MSKFDLITGTSTGGIICLFLGLGYSPAEVRDIYQFTIPRVFHQTLLRRMNFFAAQYSEHPKKRILDYFYGAETKLGDVKRNWLVTAFRLDGKSRKQGEREVSSDAQGLVAHTCVPVV